MRFGLFGGARVQRGEPGDTSARGLADYIAYNIEAEALGFHSTFLTEHHFTGVGQISAPMQVLTAIAMRTTRLRLGTAVMVLAWHNPVMLAEQAATLDLISNGRLELGVGRGYRAAEFHGFSMPMEEAEERFDESVALLVKSFTSEQRFSHHGRFWHYDDVLVEPAPMQRPHPPLWMAAGNPGSIRKVAELGCNLLLDQFQSPAQIAERIALYRSVVESKGRAFDPMQVAVARNVYVAECATDRQKAMTQQVAVHRKMVELSQRPDGANRSHILQYASAPGSTEEHALFGTPDEIIPRIEALRAVGVRQILINSGGNALESLRRFARQVMPHVGEVASSRASRASSEQPTT
jgi:alkanesulfonate monooxygenase SsuD/methylene tetrahydromethanopterin reductase-like flavin-dependent oxidoreductase (luciferase family)